MIILYTPCMDKEEAEKIATEVIQAKLAACANQLDSKSMYFWEGTLQYEPEAILLLKTTEEKEQEARKKIEEAHSYDCPAILSWKVEVNEEYERWVEEQVS